MQASNAPSKSAVPFAESGNKNTIPVDSQIGVTPGAASFTDGFPPLTMTPLVAGGVPPYGADFNGILNFLSAATRWSQAGAGYKYDSSFAAAVGGYPRGAMLLSADGTGMWRSTAENNGTDPDAGGAGWAAQPTGIATAAEASAGVNGSKVLTPSVVGALLPLRGHRVYNTAGVHTWAVPVGVSRVRVTVIGGGGGGGGAFSPSGSGASGGGGGGGAYGVKLVDLTGVTSVSVTVGAGGSGGISNTTNPTSGGSSSFGTYVSASGGSPGGNGSSGSANGGAGGLASTGSDYGGAGQGGATGLIKDGVFAIAGLGGSTQNGGSYTAPNVTGSSALGVSGSSGTNGAGGSGGAAYNATASGGAGSPGFVLIEW